MGRSPSPSRTRRQQPYAAGTRVLCTHHDNKYEARILNVSQDGDTQLFFVHYMGWKERYDEWVTLSRLSPFDEAVLQEEKRRREAEGVPQTSPPNNGKAKSKSAAKKNSAKRPAPEPASTAAQSEPDVKSDTPLEPKTASKCKLPPEIRQQLATDYMLIQRGLVHRLPKWTTVRAIVEDFRGKRVRASGSDRSLTVFCTGLVAHFDVLLGRSLLYRTERPQLLSERSRSIAKSEGAAFAPSDRYGCEHLCRHMHNVIEELSSDTGLWARCEGDVMAAFEKHLDAFLEYLALRVYRDCENAGVEPGVVSA